MRQRIGMILVLPLPIAVVGGGLWLLYQGLPYSLLALIPFSFLFGVFILFPDSGGVRPPLAPVPPPRRREPKPTPAPPPKGK